MCECDEEVRPFFKRCCAIFLEEFCEGCDMIAKRVIRCTAVEYVVGKKATRDFLESERTR